MSCLVSPGPYRNSHAHRISYNSISRSFYPCACRKNRRDALSGEFACHIPAWKHIPHARNFQRVTMQFIRISESRWQGGVPSRIQEAFLKLRTWINYSMQVKRALVHTTLVLTQTRHKAGHCSVRETLARSST